MGVERLISSLNSAVHQLTSRPKHQDTIIGDNNKVLFGDLEQDGNLRTGGSKFSKAWPRLGDGIASAKASVVKAFGSIINIKGDRH